MFQRILLISTISIIATVGCGTVPHSRVASYDPAVSFNPSGSDWQVRDRIETIDMDGKPSYVVKEFTHLPSRTVITAEYYPNRLAETELMAVDNAHQYRLGGYQTTRVEKISGERGARFTFQATRPEGQLPVTVVYARPVGKNVGLIRYRFVSPKGTNFDPTPLLVTE